MRMHMSASSVGHNLFAVQWLVIKSLRQALRSLNLRVGLEWNERAEKEVVYHRTQGRNSHERMRAVTHRGKAIITHVFEARPAQCNHELIGRLDRHLLICNAVKQQEGRHPARVNSLAASQQNAAKQNR
jgi:hypothetical protein